MLAGVAHTTYASHLPWCLQEPDEDGDDDTVTASGEPGGFIRGGVTYSPGDCVYVTPNTFDSLEDEDAPKVEVQHSTSGPLGTTTLGYIHWTLHSMLL